MSGEIIKRIDTAKGGVSIYKEQQDTTPSFRWTAVIALPGGLLFPMIERNSEISEDEILKMI